MQVPSFADSTTPRISVSRYCPAFFEGIPCQWKRQFSPPLAVLGDASHVVKKDRLHDEALTPFNVAVYIAPLGAGRLAAYTKRAEVGILGRAVRVNNFETSGHGI
jgi:hypothetical protein